MPGRKDNPLTVEIKPNRDDVWTAILSHSSKLRRVNLLKQEASAFLSCHSLHAFLLIYE
jgi:hypothetical protein